MHATLSAVDSPIHTFTRSKWDQPGVETDATAALERGHVLHFPNLSFELSREELMLLDPALVDLKQKNINYRPARKSVNGVVDSSKIPAVMGMLDRYFQFSKALMAQVLPEYRDALHTPTNSLRLHPVTAWRDNTSWRKDDTRLHTDAFPSRPNRGERIIRLFTNINPLGQPRCWRVGESFEDLARHFLPRFKRYSAMNSWVQQKLHITKGYRSHYDHMMLQLHDAMKADLEYQRNGKQWAIDFYPGSSWICYSDQTPHAAMGGQFMLEQTYLLPVKAMKDPNQSPLKILERLMRKPLI